MTSKKNRPAVQGNPNKTKHTYNNSLATQRTRTLSALQTNAQISTFYFRNVLGIAHPAGRIKELRAQYNILRTWIKESDQNGVIHRIASYSYQGLNATEEV